MTDVYAESGTEKYVRWAKTKLIALSQIREDLRLEAMRKHFVPESGVRIDIESSIYGDRIRIFGGIFLVQVGNFSGNHWQTFSRSFNLEKTSGLVVPDGYLDLRMINASKEGMAFGVAQIGVTTARKYSFQPLKGGIPSVLGPTATLDLGLGVELQHVLSRDLQYVWSEPYQTAFDHTFHVVEAKTDATVLLQRPVTMPWDVLALSAVQSPGNEALIRATGTYGGFDVNPITGHDWATVRVSRGGGASITTIASGGVLDVPGNGQWSQLYGGIDALGSPDDSTTYAWGVSRTNSFLVLPGQLQSDLVARMYRNGAEIDSWAFGTVVRSNEQGAITGGVGISDFITATNETGSGFVYALGDPGTDSPLGWRVYRNGAITALRPGGTILEDVQQAWVTNAANRVIVWTVDSPPKLWYYTFDGTNWVSNGTVEIDPNTASAAINPETGKLVAFRVGQVADEFDLVAGVPTKIKTTVFPVANITDQDMFTNKI